MNIYINYNPTTDEIVSYCEGPDDSQNECPDGCEVLVVDSALIKFDPLRMKVSGGQLTLKG